MTMLSGSPAFGPDRCSIVQWLLMLVMRRLSDARTEGDVTP